jgi:thiol-disulfide isomerase/thioredoxin
MVRRASITRFAFAFLPLLVACERPVSPALAAAPRPAPVVAGTAAARPVDPGRMHALLINGGGSPAQNYQSHHLHLQTLLDLLRNRGLADKNIAVFSSDGAHPAPDQAVRASQPEPGFWQLDGTRLGDHLRTPVKLESSRLPGIEAGPATQAAIGRWFAEAGQRLRPGDTLFLYVTDHGTKGARDPRNNEITLWGKDQSLTVDELETMLARLPAGVTVVSLMSQCFSGGFARLEETLRGGDRPRFCGYFSSTADRPAYGCYPENHDRDNVGHSFHFFASLQDKGALAAAQREVLATDHTPDVPLSTSDSFLEALLTRAAQRDKQTLTALADGLLKEAWKDGKTWEPEIRLLDRIGQVFGMWSPRSLAELEAQAGTLPTFSKQVEAHQEAWASALGDLNVRRLLRLEEQAPEWRSLLRDSKVQMLDERGRRALTARLLAALDQLPLDRQRLQAVHERSEQARALAYRLEVRLGVVLRLRARLLNVAGRVYLARRGSEADRQAFARLTACEGLQLPAAAAPRPPLLSEKEAFPPFKDDLALAQRVLPAWMGIRFDSTSPEVQKKYGLPSGAALVRGVLPGSPAASAGLQAGDILLGPREHPFTGYNEVRVWTFLSTPGMPQKLDLVRAGQRLSVSLTPAPFPGEMPAMPGPPQPGSPAPALSIAPYRGKLAPALAPRQPHLLFFWATYCGPCKASLPEVLAFGKARGVPVVAISDEPLATLNEFFQTWKKPFPEIVAHDELRQAAIAYGTSGVPTFVYVDDKGVIASLVTGYAPDRGIGVPGWKHR